MTGKTEWGDDKATTEWLDAFRAKRNTRNTYATGWRKFQEFTGMTGDQILADRKADAEFRWEGKTLQFKQWMILEKKLSQNTGRTGAECVEGFFSFHRLPLKFRKSEAAAISRAQRKQEDYRFSREDLKRMFDVADLIEKYVIVAGKSFGLRAGDFLHLTRGDLEPYVDREPPISIGEFQTQKENVPAFPFIDSDAQPVIKLMLEKMGREGKAEPSGKMLPYKNAIQLSRTLQRLADRAGINYGSKNIRFHCMRKFLIDHLSSHMSSEKWKQIVGKTITEGAYVSPDSLREDYQRAMAETAFEKPEGDVEKIAKKQALLIFAKVAGMTEKDVEELFGKRRGMRRRSLTLNEEIEVLEEAVAEKRPGEKAKNCAGGEHCQRVVGEEELPDLLAGGWRVAAVLPSGKIVVADE